MTTKYCQFKIPVTFYEWDYYSSYKYTNRIPKPPYKDKHWYNQRLQPGNLQKSKHKKSPEIEHKCIYIYIYIYI